MEIVCLKSGDKKICLEKVDDTDSTYRIAWRGNKRTKEGFINNPPYFKLETLASLLRQSFENKKIEEKERNKFINILFGWE